MDLSGLRDSLPLLIGLVVILVLFAFFRRGGSIRRRPEMIQGLIYELRLNQVLVETFHLREKPRRFETTHWQINKEKLDFLDESLRGTLTWVFERVEDFNRQIKAAKKAKTLHQLNLNVEELKEPMAESRKGLEDWLEEHTGHRELPPRYPTLFGSLFGER